MDNIQKSNKTYTYQGLIQDSKTRGQKSNRQINSKIYRKILIWDPKTNRQKWDTLVRNINFV